MRFLDILVYSTVLPHTTPHPPICTTLKSSEPASSCGWSTQGRMQLNAAILAIAHFLLTSFMLWLPASSPESLSLCPLANILATAWQCLVWNWSHPSSAIETLRCSWNGVCSQRFWVLPMGLVNLCSVRSTIVLCKEEPKGGVKIFSLRSSHSGP